MKSCCFGWETLFSSFKCKIEVTTSVIFFFFWDHPAVCILIWEGVVSCQALSTVILVLWLNKLRIREKKKLCVYELYSIHRNKLPMMTLFATSVYVAFSNLWNLDNLKLIQNGCHKHQTTEEFCSVIYALYYQ